MKRIILLLVTLGALSSCSNYLDVKPTSQIDKNALFSTEEGFKEALNGVYSNCISTDTYGNELTFGFLDVLAQNYSITDNSSSVYPYKATMQFVYTDKYFIDRKDKVWAGLYSAIGNCNSLLENIELRKDVLSEQNYRLIKGEALGLRGYLHLDLIRMFAPSFATGADKPAIPYVTKFTNLVVQQLTVKDALDSVINDLSAARRLLQDVDPILNSTYVVGYTTDGPDGDTDPDDHSTEEKGPFFDQNRRHRLNYYAVCGALARANLCRNNKAEALEYAKEVIESKKFPWVKKEDFANVDDELKDRVLYPELVFGWAISSNKDIVRGRFENGNISIFVAQDPGNAIYEKATVGGEDIRFKQWFKVVTDITTASNLVLRKYHREEINRHPLMAPAIRLSEMYYIAAECSYDVDQNAAWSYFNQVRLNRGIGGIYAITEGSKDDLLSELLKEARKEFYGEGQIFYMYKRLNQGISALDGSTIGASNDIFKLPLPDSEIELGLRN